MNGTIFTEFWFWFILAWAIAVTVILLFNINAHRIDRDADGWPVEEREDYNRLVPCCECGQVLVRAFMKRCDFCDTEEGKMK